MPKCPTANAAQKALAQLKVSPLLAVVLNKETGGLIGYKHPTDDPDFELLPSDFN